jgi:hypothetical protein
MIHAAQQMIGIEHDLMTALTLDVRDEADAAAIVLEFGPIEALRRRQAVSSQIGHGY